MRVAGVHSEIDGVACPAEQHRIMKTLLSISIIGRHTPLSIINICIYQWIKI